jgi:hypothetical protein
MIIPFIPGPTEAFRFTPTLDGQTYSVVVPWSLFGRRWYINLLNLNGRRIFSKALIGSDLGRTIESLTWAGGAVLLTTELPHGYKYLDTINVSVTGCFPVEYNGRVQALVTGDRTLRYPLAVRPGGASQFGVVAYEVNLIENYFTTSTLIYRTQTKQFEVTP